MDRAEQVARLVDALRTDVDEAGRTGRRVATALAGWDADELALAERFLELMTDAVVAHRQGGPP